MERYFFLATKVIVRKYAIVRNDLYDILCDADSFIRIELELQSLRQSEGLAHTNKYIQKFANVDKLKQIVSEKDLLSECVNEFHVTSSLYLCLRESGLNNLRKKTTSRLKEVANLIISIHQILLKIKQFLLLIPFMNVFIDELYENYTSIANWMWFSKVETASENYTKFLKECHCSLSEEEKKILNYDNETFVSFNDIRKTYQKGKELYFQKCFMMRPASFSCRNYPRLASLTLR